MVIGGEGCMKICISLVLRHVDIVVTYGISIYRIAYCTYGVVLLIG